MCRLFSISCREKEINFICRGSSPGHVLTNKLIDPVFDWVDCLVVDTSVMVERLTQLMQGNVTA